MFDKILSVYRNYQLVLDERQNKKYMREVEAFAISQGKTLDEMVAIFKRVDITFDVPKITPQYPTT